jgi:6-pyruvoyl-tetrahydropterin synthase
MTSLFVERLTIVDFSYLDGERGLLGESWLVDVTLEGDLDGQGMIFDFGLVKKLIKQWVDVHIDHKLVVPAASDRTSWRGGQVSGNVAFHADCGLIEHWGPENSVCAVPASYVDVDVIGDWMALQIKPMLPASVRRVSITLRPEAIEHEPHYQYSHGLQGHLGACQRIAHGHRSRIRVWLDGAPSEKWARHWAKRWRDIYLATRGHVLQNLPQGRLLLGYRAADGEFKLALPAERVYLLDTPSTVEWIAHHLASQTARATGARVTVQAFEGIDKGAIAHA